MAVRVNREDFFEKIQNNGKLSLVDFYSDSCVPCKIMSPVLAELEEELGERLFVGKVNVAYDRELAEEYEVKSVPVFLLVKDGAVVERFSGVQKKDILKAAVEKYL